MFESQLAAVNSLSQDGPVAVELETIDETQFDRVIAEAQQREESVIIVWYYLLNAFIIPSLV